MLYFVLALALVFLVYLIVRELMTKEDGFTKGKKLPVQNEEVQPTFNLSDNIEITQKDCLNQCRYFQNNPEDLKYCQKFCSEYMNFK